VEAEMSFGLTDAPCQDGQILPRKSV